MKATTFSNGTRICAIGQGTWNMGRNPLKRKEETAALLAGIEMGMTMVDTAEMYDNEKFIGRAIDGVRDKVFLVSKVHPSNADYQGTIHACEESLRRLKTDCLDLYLLHWKSRHPFSETIEAMTELQHSGKIRMWGVSNIDLPDMEEIENISQGYACDADQVLYNLQERGVEYDLIPWARQYEMPIIAYSPIGEGKLKDSQILKNIAEKHGATPVQIALAWTIRQPGIIAIPKAGTVEHVRENFGALSVVLDADDLKTLDAFFPRRHARFRWPDGRNRRNVFYEPDIVFYAKEDKTVIGHCILSVHHAVVP